MEEKRLTEKESLELIAGMIRNTKSKLEIGDGNMMLFWGYLSIAVAVVVGLVALLTRSPHGNWLWFLIPIIGFPMMKHWGRKKKSEALVSTYVDKISAGIWKIVGGLGFSGTLMCIGFRLFGYNVWQLMFIYPFIIVGFAGAVQGIVIRENSLIIGGIFSIIAGGFVICCCIGGIPLSMEWACPLFVFCFICMMIVPGHIINNKAKKQCLKN